MTVTDFVLARLAEDEADVHAGPVNMRNYGLLHDPARVLAQCAAMRRIVEDHKWSGLPDHHRSSEALELAPDRCRRCWAGPGFTEWPCSTVRALASIWSDHPDYRQEWA